MAVIEMIEPGELIAWDKNPRERDPERFELIKLSLRKFGFVMPVYARRDGLLFSGHQRTSAAIELGFKYVPVMWVEGSTEQVERGLNILFNVCTNDHARKSDFGQRLSIDSRIVEQLPDTDDFYPCLRMEMVRPAHYLSHPAIAAANAMTRDFAEELYGHGVRIPVIMDESGVILNGAPRLAAAAAAGLLEHPVVRVKGNTEALQQCLNQITMSFDLQKAFGEELRYNSFFRSRNQGSQRIYLGGGFYEWVFGKEARRGGRNWLMKHMITLEGQYRDRFIREHGNCCIDFGAGRLDNQKKLVAAGIECAAFEPFLMRPGTDTINPAGAKIMARKFLKWLSKSPPVSSVFCSSVFNSVPFKTDRDMLMVIFQALCSRGATLYLHTRSDKMLKSKVFIDPSAQAMRERQTKSILLDAEPGLFVGEIMRRPKVQKFHSPDELQAMGKQFFRQIDYYPGTSTHGIRCRAVREIDYRSLKAAIVFEFNLPYPDGTRMDLSDAALDAFSAYLGKDLHHV